MDSSHKKNTDSKKKDPPNRHRPDEGENRDTTESPSSSSPPPKTSTKRSTSSSPKGMNGVDVDVDSHEDRSYLADVKQQARAAAARAASSGVYRTPVAAVTAPESTTNTTPRSSNGSKAIARAMQDARAKARGRKPPNSDSSSVRHKPQRKSMPSHLKSSVSGSNSNNNATKLQRLQEEVAAKTRGRAPSASAGTTTAQQRKRPTVLTSRMGMGAALQSQSHSSLGSSLSAVKKLNRMEADIAAKERARASRGSGTPRAKRNSNNNSNTGTGTSTTPSRLDRMEAEIAAKAKVGRASAALQTNQQSNGNGHGSSNSTARNKKSSRADAIAKKLQTFGAANKGNTRTPASNPETAPSKRNEKDQGNEDKKKKPAAAVAGASSASTSVGKKQTGASAASSSSKNHNYRLGGNENGVTASADHLNLPGGNDNELFDDEASVGKGDDTNGLAVAVAVHEDENAFIPSAVEYDPDARLPVYKHQRFRVYSLLTCTLLIIMTTCAIAILTIREKNAMAADWAATEPPTCPRCTREFLEYMELEVGSQRLQDPTSPEFRAKEWILHEDPMQLMPEDPNFIQRFLLAAFYFDTHQIADWRSCNRQSLDPAKNETERCNFQKISVIKPLTFAEFPSNRWLGSGDECEWAGIACDFAGHVRRIDLHGQGIHGTLPFSFSRLPYVQLLSLHYNNFTGTLPGEYGKLKHMIHIELHNNKFTGTFPASWSNIRNLQQLNLAENFLTGQLPAGVGDFRIIKGLYLYGNKLSGTLPAELANASSLSYLRLHKNSFEGTIPPEFGDMQLVELWLHKNPYLTGSIPAEFGKLSNSFVDLRLYQTAMNGALPESLYSLSQLWRLELSQAGFTGTISPNATKLGSLQVLRLSDNQFTGTVPTELGSMTNLIELVLRGNMLTGSVPSGICNLKEEHSLQFVSSDCLESFNRPEEISCECCDVCCDAGGFFCEQFPENAFALP